MVKIWKALIVSSISLIIGIYAGIKYTNFVLNQKIREARINTLQQNGSAIDPAQSISDDLHRISFERELLKQHIKISEQYMENNDIDGFNKWISKMKAHLEQPEQK